jgi:putative MATE family efflux protein
MMQDNRDSLDFGKMNIPKLYGKILFPTLIGMVATVSSTVINGIFVGHGLGRDAIAAVNIIIPLFMFVSGISLMFGVGASVVASVHLSKGKIKAANINITQSFGIASVLMIVLSVLLMIFNKRVAELMGSTQYLLPLTTEYLLFIAPGFVFQLISSIGLFIIRLDGSPKYAMLCSLIPALINIVLDYFVIFIFDWGIKGAGLSTSIGAVIGGAMVLIYMFGCSRKLRFYRLKFSVKSMCLTARNIGYQIKLGSSAMISELGVGVMMATGNLVFVQMLGEDGVAAFSVACYCYPIVFMINTAVAMSAQPIISYNYGQQNMTRVKNAFKLMVFTGLLCGLLATFAFITFPSEVASLFISVETNAHDIAINGLPLFAVGFVFFALNITFIGYFQSTEKAKSANWYSALRGIILPVACFLIIPKILGVKGVWLSVPTADIIVFIIMSTVFVKTHFSHILITNKIRKI